VRCPKILCFGEAMLELSRTRPGAQDWHMGVAGDTYNVAVYLRRLGCDVGYMTAPWSARGWDRSGA
jgi:2-dehydro-3-deoxygluconokinase